MGRSGHALNRNASMHDSVVVHLIVVDDGGLAVNGRHPLRRQAAMAEVVIAKVAKGDKCKGVDPEAKVEVRPHGHTIEPPAQPHIEFGVRRQRRPAAGVPA
jgi:hypothetical protein